MLSKKITRKEKGDISMPHKMFKAGQRLNFTTDSPLYPDVYEAEIQQVYPDRLDLKLSLHHGYLLLIPAGTEIRWLLPEDKEKLISRVIDRDMENKIWRVTFPNTSPGSISHTRVLAVGSGKGGVGKTSFSINLSLALSDRGQKVILMDGDIGMANVEVLLGLHSYYNLSHVIEGECSLPDILLEGPGGIHILPGYSGISALAELTPLKFNRIIAGFEKLEDSCDMLVLDTGAGMSEPVLKFIEAADEFILLTTPEPHALMDAYALIKVLAHRNKDVEFKMILNSCESEREALQCRDRFIHAAKNFLKVEPSWLGWLPETHLVSRSIKQKTPVYIAEPKSDYIRKIIEISDNLLGTKSERNKSEGGLKNFFKQIKAQWLNN